jgi:thiamine biosynthesis lipoprotein
VGGTWEFPGVPKRVLLCRRALSSSGTEVKGRHIIDPRTGRPAEGHLAAWVSHPTAAVSDALSTAFMSMSSKEVRRYCEKHPDVWALLVTPKRKTLLINRDIFSA